jgi:hypothetical protein
MTKGEKLEQRYVNASWGKVEVGHEQRWSNIEECERIKFLDKRSTQVGGASS